jgi:hypothetical protein
MIVGRGRRADVPDSPLPFLQEVFQNHSLFLLAQSLLAALFFSCCCTLCAIHPFSLDI